MQKGNRGTQCKSSRQACMSTNTAVKTTGEGKMSTNERKEQCEVERSKTVQHASSGSPDIIVFMHFYKKPLPRRIGAQLTVKNR
jgi:hypothetical protein